MTPEMIELARYLITCKNWCWMEGMEAIPVRFEKERWLICWCSNDGKEAGAYQTSGGKWWNIANNDTELDLSTDWLPNLEDPATLGCLLQLVREAYVDQCACVFPIDYGPAGVMWQVRLTANGRQVTDRHYTTEAEALVAALEAAS